MIWAVQRMVSWYYLSPLDAPVKVYEEIPLFGHAVLPPPRTPGNISDSSPALILFAMDQR